MAALLAAPVPAQTSLTPQPPGLGQSPGELATPDQLAPQPATIPGQSPGAQDVPSIGEGQLQEPADASVFEQYHTTMSFGPPRGDLDVYAEPGPPPPGRLPAPVRGPHTSLAQLRLALDDVDARRAAHDLIVEAEYRRRREALRADQDFRGLPRARRRELLRSLAAGRDAQRRAIDEAARRLREAVNRRIKEKTP